MSKKLEALFNKAAGHSIREVSARLKDDSGVCITFANGDRLEIDHVQDCCEEVYLEDIFGIESLEDLKGETVLELYLSDNFDPADSYPTWTFIVLRTGHYSVTFHWRGISNGYYSEKPNSFEWYSDDKLVDNVFDD